MLPRFLTSALLDALSDTPAVLLVGARQVGKSTLTQLAQPDRVSLTLDDLSVLSAAQGDAQGFVTGLPKTVTLDEIQRAPGLFLPIKAAIDQGRQHGLSQPGRFLLTGSANVLTLPAVADSLAGRLEVLTLWPLSQGEIEGQQERFIDLAFGEDSPPLTLPGLPETELLPRLLRGGYPEVQARTPSRRKAFFRSYLNTILSRDVQALANIEGLAQLPNLLSLLAARSSGLLNTADLARAAGLPHSTFSRYLTLLDTVYLTLTVPAWASNHTKRLVKAPKVQLVDTGLSAHLLGLDEARLKRERTLLGPLLEGFVTLELLKARGWSEAQPGLYHYRTHTGQEVDLLLEHPDGRLVGVEIKASASPTASDFRGLKALQAEYPERFHRGLVLHLGERAVPFGERLHALPVSSLWTWR
jgi:uncharacterized protein